MVEWIVVITWCALFEMSLKFRTELSYVAVIVLCNSGYLHFSGFMCLSIRCCTRAEPVRDLMHKRTLFTSFLQISRNIFHILWATMETIEMYLIYKQITYYLVTAAIRLTCLLRIWRKFNEIASFLCYTSNKRSTSFHFRNVGLKDVFKDMLFDGVLTAAVSIVSFCPVRFETCQTSYKNTISKRPCSLITPSYRKLITRSTDTKVAFRRHVNSEKHFVGVINGNINGTNLLIHAAGNKHMDMYLLNNILNGFWTF